MATRLSSDPGGSLGAKLCRFFVIGGQQRLLCVGLRVACFVSSDGLQRRNRVEATDFQLWDRATGLRSSCLRYLELPERDIQLEPEFVGR